MSMAQLKSKFAVQSNYEAFYTGRKVQISNDGCQMFCHCGNVVKVLDIATGNISKTIGEEADDDEVTCFILSPDDQIFVVASQNLQLRQWDIKENQVTRTWKSIHTGPVLCMSFDSTSTLLATGGSDATIKVWDVIKQYCTHNLKGHKGVISVVEFHPDTSKLQLFTAGADDHTIRIWNLQTSSVVAELSSHFSVVTSLQFSADANTLYSSSRDQVVTLWNLNSNTKTKTLPVFEPVESIVLLPDTEAFPELNASGEESYFITGGTKGTLRVWNVKTGQCVFTKSAANTQESDGDEEEESEDQQAQRAIISATYCKTLQALTVVTAEKNIILYKLQDLSIHKQFVGYNDDVLEIQWLGSSDSHLAVATNSQLIKVFKADSWDCQMLAGHKDIVVSLDVHPSGNMLLSGSKDNSLRVWKMDECGQLRCVAVGHGHTHVVNTVAFSRLGLSYVVSGSQDCTLKVWPLPDNLGEEDEPLRLHTQATEHAHEKDINSVAVAPNDKLIATGSQDKTAKLWHASSLALVGVFRGHKRGIWCVQFSPVDQVMATASADSTLKIWSIKDFTCVMTFEGHQSSVLKVLFLTRGMQLLSSGSDGLVKLWTIKSTECVGTFDEHEDKVWALTCNKEEDRVVTGAGDSTIKVWKDVTVEEQEEARAVQEDFILKEQELSNLLHNKKYLKAIALAITLDQPFRVLGILKEVLGEPSGDDKMEKTMAKLREDQLDAVLRYAVKWNTNSKHCHVAQYVVSVLLSLYTPDQLAKLPNMKSTLEGLIPYTEKHFQRMNRLLQQSTFVDYTWQSMKLVESHQPDKEEEMDVTDSSKTGGSTGGFHIDRTRHQPRSDDTSDSDTSDSDTDNIKPTLPMKSKTHINDDDDSSSNDDSDEEQHGQSQLKTTIKAKLDSKEFIQETQPPSDKENMVTNECSKSVERDTTTPTKRKSNGQSQKSAKKTKNTSKQSPSSGKKMKGGSKLKKTPSTEPIKGTKGSKVHSPKASRRRSSAK